MRPFEINKKIIDDMSDIELLKTWRFSSSDNELVQGKSGDYLSTKIFGIRDNDPIYWSHLSKLVGW